MRLLEAWVATPLAGAVGWALLHSLWEGAIVSAALAAVFAVRLLTLVEPARESEMKSGQVGFAAPRDPNQRAPRQQPCTR